MSTIFEYMYRDADNFKAFGSVLLDGPINEADKATVRSRLESGEFFIAEQVGLSPLYAQLYQWSNGPTESDHCWHEFVGFRESGESTDEFSSTIPAREFVGRFAAVRDWNEELSRHFWLADPLVTQR